MDFELLSWPEWATRIIDRKSKPKSNGNSMTTKRKLSDKEALMKVLKSKSKSASLLKKLKAETKKRSPAKKKK